MYRRAQVLRTRDGGETWSILGKLDASLDRQPAFDTEIRFVDEVHGWAFESLLAWTSSDGGTTWRRSPPSLRLDGELATLHRGQFLSPESGWLSGELGLICQTSDGGVTWRSRRVASSRQDIGAMFFINPSTGWVAEWPRGAIYHTTDGGENWHSQRTPLPVIGITSIHFIDEDHGWAAGAWEPNGPNKPYTSVALLLHTEDGGLNWSVLRTEEAEIMCDAVYFGDQQHGWLLSSSRAPEGKAHLVDRDRLWRTTNGGQTWRLSLDSQAVRALTSGKDR
jgi:photosystem II stability/assembly factor-like uncharacterized protein